MASFELLLGSATKCEAKLVKEVHVQFGELGGCVNLSGKARGQHGARPRSSKHGCPLSTTDQGRNICGVDCEGRCISDCNVDAFVPTLGHNVVLSVPVLLRVITSRRH